MDYFQNLIVYIAIYIGSLVITLEQTEMNEKTYLTSPHLSLGISFRFNGIQSSNLNYILYIFFDVPHSATFIFVIFVYVIASITTSIQYTVSGFEPTAS